MNGDMKEAVLNKLVEQIPSPVNYRLQNGMLELPNMSIVITVNMESAEVRAWRGRISSAHCYETFEKVPFWRCDFANPDLFEKFSIMLDYLSNITWANPRLSDTYLAYAGVGFFHPDD